MNFEFVCCGLTKEQALRYALPESPEKPGEYQWEALADEDAREIIEWAMAQYLDHGIIDKVEKQAEKATEKWQEKVQKAIEKLVKANGRRW